MKKVLFVASVTGHIAAFHLPYLKYFKSLGWQTEVLSRGEKAISFCDKHYHVDIQRNPFHKENLVAYKQIKQIIKNGSYDIIHCHTPVAAMLTRLAAKKARKKGTRVFYTVHGFHFFKGAPLRNWLIYFPIEWISAFLTDVLITINKEDYAFAQKHMHAKKVCYVPGVGLDTEAVLHTEADRAEKRKEMGVPADATVLLSVGELNANKNHALMIRALAKMKNSNIHYCIAGKGDKLRELEDLACDSGISENVHFLGYRTDVRELLWASDIFCFPSFREGLPVSLMEAMAAGLPCVATKIRGNTDLIENGRNGILISPTDAEAAKAAVEKLMREEGLRETMRRNNMADIQAFDYKHVKKMMIDIYA